LNVAEAHLIGDGHTAPMRQPARPFRSEMSSNVLGVVMNIPTLATLTLVLAYPIFYAAYLSMHKVTLAELRRGIFPFVGFDNYRRHPRGPHMGLVDQKRNRYSYKKGFAPPFDIGVASASAYVLALIVGAIAIGYVGAIYRRVQ
jgi:ABC-type sugar transport system permease subunit